MGRFMGQAADTGETYDLVVVGGGISGLSAAHFYRAQAGRPVKILVLDNHDDFGGHAKRNEFHLDGKLHLMNGGTLEIDSPTPYSPEAAALLKTLGVDPVALSKACDKPEVYASLGMGRGVAFDKETFGEDRLVAGVPPERESPADAVKPDAVAAWREMPFFSERERAAFGWAESLTHVSQTGAPDADYDALKPAYTDPTVWDNFDPGLLTLCSPDPQAIRPPDGKANELLVTLPTNFKVAKFDSEKYTQILRDLENDIEAVRFDPGDGTKIELPVKLRVHDSLFVPLAKWSMLLAGNYRCITKDGMRTAQEAVHTNIEESKSVYNFVFDLCVRLGANPNDLVPFEKYAAAAQSLSRPASAARALQNGAQYIERADKLVQLIAKQKGLSNPAIDAQVALVDARLETNRKKAAA